MPVPSAQVDPYEVLNISRNASKNEAKVAYFDKATPFHPDLTSSSDPIASSTFTTISECYWVLCNTERRRLYDETGEMDLREFSLETISKDWLQEFLLDSQGVEDCINYEMLGQRGRTRHERFIMEHFEAPSRHGSRGHSGNLVGDKKLRCKLCNLHMKGEEVFLAHLKRDHHLELSEWEHDVRTRCKDAFGEFVRAGLAIDESRLFTCADGLAGGFNDTIETFPLYGHVDLDLALQNISPFDPMDVSRALTSHAPEEMAHVLEQMQKLQPEAASFLLPTEGVELNMDLLQSEGKMQRKSRHNKGSRALYSFESQQHLGGMTNCSCGFTSGTTQALSRHFDRFAGDPSHEPVL